MNSRHRPVKTREEVSLSIYQILAIASIIPLSSTAMALIMLLGHLIGQEIGADYPIASSVIPGAMGGATWAAIWLAFVGLLYFALPWEFDSDSTQIPCVAHNGLCIICGALAFSTIFAAPPLGALISKRVFHWEAISPLLALTYSFYAASFIVVLFGGLLCAMLAGPNI